MSAIERREPHTTGRKRGRSRLSVAALVGAVVAALVLPVSPALAAPTIPTGGTGSLTIHKFETPDSGVTVGTGEALPSATTDAWTPVPGVTFRVRQVNTIDLTTNAGWDAAAALADRFNAAGGDVNSITSGSPAYTLGAAKAPDAAVTDGDGIQKFSALPIGLYLVEEVGVPTQIDGENVGVTPAAPFLVTVPITNQAGNEWLYEVHAYPKNAVISQPEKTVTDSGVVQVGDQTKWTVSAEIQGTPADLDGNGVIEGNQEKYHFDFFAMVDDLDPRLKPLTGGDYNLTHFEVKLSGGVTSDEVIVLRDYYSVGYTAATNQLRMVLRADALAMLPDHHGGTITFTFYTTALESGTISNTADVYTHQYRAESGSVVRPEPGTPGGPATTTTATQKFGGIRVLKTDDANQALAGAEFEVYTGLLPSGAPDPAKKVTVSPTGGTAVATWTSDANGELVIDGLRYSDWADGEDIDLDDSDVVGDADGEDAANASKFITYYLVEVKAPEGYSLLGAPVKFTVRDQAAETGESDLDVVNVPVNAGFQLPLTGGTGTTLLFTVGGLLVAGGVVYLLAARRRRGQAAADTTSTLALQ
ncbi:SpaH/EbpB family LPXTG-anchored major pilin [Leucobacter massiliensis]|uniref:SpaH/EbpB family LPXTG-anchored major pilin n=1 Tax=Leucobacter massiliensis TaxID=1686285 RepID=UPI0011B205FA|nr:SpaH/EbpB family LPXTG-anchored major pilin [Leucobacter massiliensis]